MIACHSLISPAPAQSQERGPVGDFRLRWRATTIAYWCCLRDCIKSASIWSELDRVSPDEP